MFENNQYLSIFVFRKIELIFFLPETKYENEADKHIRHKCWLEGMSFCLLLKKGSWEIHHVEMVALHGKMFYFT